MEIAVAVLFVCVAIAFIFVRLTSARKEAQRLGGEAKPEGLTPPTEAPLPERPERLGAKVRSLLSRDAGENAWRALHDILL